MQLCFIAKSDMMAWPGINWLAWMQRTVFVRREDRRGSKAQAGTIAARLVEGDAMVLFAEGTTGDGIRLRPFKSALFGAVHHALETAHISHVTVQPVALAYTRLNGLPLGRYHQARAAWPGDIPLGPHLMTFIAGGAYDVEVVFGEAGDFALDTPRKKIADITAPPGSRRLRQRHPDAPDRAATGRCLIAAPRACRTRAMNELPKPESLAADGNQRKVFIKTYGCQMNVYDMRSAWRDALAADGYAATGRHRRGRPRRSSTPAISARRPPRRSIPQLGRIRKLKDERAQGRPRDDGRRRRLRRAGRGRGDPRAARRGRSRRRPAILSPPAANICAARGPASRSSRPTSRSRTSSSTCRRRPRARRRARGVTAFLTVQEGCDKFCTFCVVPYTRGAEVSRAGGADPRRGAAGSPRPACARSRCSARTSTPGMARADSGSAMRPGRLAGRAWPRSRASTRLRYTTSHPLDMDDELIAAHRDLPKLMPYLHLPVQSGSDRILKAMNRRHTAPTISTLIERIRAARPDIAISGDFIVGFPGETDADFEATLRSGAHASATRRPIRSNIRSVPARPAPTCRTRCPTRSRSSACETLQALLQRSSTTSTAR